MWNHCVKCHNNEEQEFGMKVKDYVRDDPTKRQILDAVRIKDCPADRRMNDRSEWNFVLMPRITIGT